MKSTYLFATTLLLLISISCTRKTDYENKVDKYRSQTLGFYTNPAETPLDSNELKTFKGISWFPIDQSYKVEADLIWLPLMEHIQMKQSGGDVLTYTKAAQLHFTLNGKSYILFGYQNENHRTRHELFVPFTDLTSGKTSYGGGRYLDVIFNPASNKTELDFNFAYTPFCAYTHSFSCPIVPEENRLEVEIKAGERD